MGKRIRALIPIVFVVPLVLLTACSAPPQGPPTWIDRPLDGDQFPLGLIVLQAHASDASGIGKFEFFINDILLSSPSGSGSRFSQATVEWVPPAPGTYVVRARSVNGNGNVGADAAVRIVVGAAASVTTTPSPAAKGCAGPPVIASFSANPTTITYGQTITFSWGAITNADDAIIDAIGHISLKGGAYPLQPPPIAATYPLTTTTFKLTAVGCGGTTVQQATVTLTGGSSSPSGVCVAPPAIASFTANPGKINAGQSITLTWGEISQAAFAGIDQGIGEIPVALSYGPPGSTTVSPITTTTYTLSATGCAGTTTKQVTVVVNQPVCPGPPVIASFTASPTTVTYGQTITFGWGAITNADDAIIDAIGHVSLKGGAFPLQPPPIAATYPKTTTTFTLTAVGCGGTITKQVTVVVNQPPPPAPVCPGPPVIASFDANPGTITAGQSTTLSWGAVANATSASIDPDLGGVGTPGSSSVSPAGTTTYALTATGCGGTSQRKVTVTVKPAPPQPVPMETVIRILPVLPSRTPCTNFSSPCQ